MNIYKDWNAVINAEASVLMGEINKKTGSLISEEYVRLNANLHSTNEAYGTSGGNYVKQVATAVQVLGAKTVLDYGAGKGLLKKGSPGLDIREYDPAIAEIAMRPDRADLVVCTDVLEHIEPEYLTEVLEDIHSLAIKGVFLVIACQLAKKILEDGRNAHLIVETPMWWLNKLSLCFSGWKQGGLIFDHKSMMMWIGK